MIGKATLIERLKADNVRVKQHLADTQQRVIQVSGVYDTSYYTVCNLHYPTFYYLNVVFNLISGWVGVVGISVLIPSSRLSLTYG